MACMLVLRRYELRGGPEGDDLCQSFGIFTKYFILASLCQSRLLHTPIVKVLKVKGNQNQYIYQIL